MARIQQGRQRDVPHQQLTTALGRLQVHVDPELLLEREAAERRGPRSLDDVEMRECPHSRIPASEHPEDHRTAVQVEEPRAPR
ncbi:hypothetical protein D5H75_19885 [Bailinhaonella thermotolerans]|uniref:Uncharacterized protein n=1 Tax=Bailinhaonella thermotolerans TaxID=1070861 RepID=A0A3A4BJ85_9ACTN|nr:hypothetical protein D5H75_19885 [Bailinhaonella thermotolerans]